MTPWGGDMLKSSVINACCGQDEWVRLRQGWEEDLAEWCDNEMLSCYLMAFQNPGPADEGGLNIVMFCIMFMHMSLA